MSFFTATKTAAPAVLVAILGPVAIYCSVARAEAPAVPEVEVRALAERQRIESGEVVIDTHGQRRGKTAVHRTIRCFFDAGNIRNDVRFYPDDKSSSQAREYTEITCNRKDNTQIWHSDAAPSTGKEFAVRIADPMTAGDQAAFPVVDARLLGVIARQAAGLFDIRTDALLTRPDRRESQTTETTLNGVPCIQVDYVRNDGVQVALWISPAMNHSVLRARVGSDDFSQMVDVTPERDDNSGLWFPRLCRYQQFEQGNVVYTDDAKITIVRLNQPMAPEVFDLAGMNLAPGTPVTRVPSPRGLVGELTWDGTQVVAASPVRNTPRNPLLAQGSPSDSRTVLVLCTISLALLAAVVWWRLARRG